MQGRLEVGTHVFINISNRTICEVVIAAVRGEFYVLKFLDGGAIQLKRHRIYMTMEEAEQQLPVKKVENKRTIRFPYDFEM